MSEPIFQEKVVEEPMEYLSEEPNRIIADYISSMTDSYFIALYRHLFPTSTKRLFKREYCSDLI